MAVNLRSAERIVMKLFFVKKVCDTSEKKYIKFPNEIIPALVCSSTLIRSRPRKRRNKNETKLNHLVILMAGFWTNHMVPFLIIREEFQCWPRIQWLHAICFKWPTTMAKTINNEQKRTGFGIITINPSKGRLFTDLLEFNVNSNLRKQKSVQLLFASCQFGILRCALSCPLLCELVSFVLFQRYLQTK